MRSRSRGVLAALWTCAVMVPLLLVLLGGPAATSDAAGSGGSGKEARRSVSAPASKLVAKYTTADSDTYRLPDGHMVTRVYERPINRRDAAGQWQPLTEKQSAAAKPQAEASPELSATPDAERNPLGQENEAACTLTSTAPTTSACNELTFKAGYETSSKAARRALVQFALPDLHEESTILSAQLELYAAKTTTSTGVAMGAYRVTTPWTTKATWNTSNGSTAWHTPGGDYANPEKESDAAINTSVGATTGWTYWYPTQMVQEWYNGTDAPNGQGQPDLGFLLKDVSEGATNNVVTFDGREEREHDPGLTLEWVQRGVGNATNYTQLPTALSSTQSLDVNPASGNLSIHSTDLQIASKGLAFESARTWNSLRNEAPDYGYGWVDSNAVYVEALAGDNVAYTDGSGNTFPFIKEAAEKFKTPSGIEATMCEAKSASPCPTTLPSGVTYQLINSKTGERINFGHKETFEPFVYYYVVSAENSAGEKQTAQYTGTMEYPTSWIDTEKTEIAYTESAATGYTKITAKTSPVRSTSYVEPEGEDGLYHLTVYTNEKGEKTTYRYGGESYLEGNLLTEITEPNGAITKLSYNSDYQVTKIVLIASGQKTGPTTAYTYYELGKAPAPCTSIQKATVVAETGGSEEPTLTYCSNVLDEVEAVYGYPATGQPGRSALEEEPLSEIETASVNLDSGDLLVKAEDAKPEAADQYLPLDRYYNSQAMPAANTLSPKWRWGTGPAVYLAIEGATVVVHGPSGYAEVLKQTSNSTYSAPGEYEGTLTKNANGTYTLVDEDNPTYQFNAAGVLTSETTEEGNTFTVNDETLSGKSVLHSLAPVSGKALEVTYNGTPLVTQTTNPAGGVGKYGYNAAVQLASFTAPSATKTEYEYSNGYLSKIKTPEATETITTTSGKVSEISVTRTGETGTSGEKFTYEAAKAPTCNPPSDVEETVVTQVPGEAKTSFCFNARGENTTPRTTEQNEVEGEGEQPEISPEACKKEHPGTYCGEEEVPPESNEEEGEDAILDAVQPAGIPALVPRKKELEPSRYAISDNNRVTEREGHHAFDIFTNLYFQALHVVSVRRTIPWNLVYEAERAPITVGSKEAIEEAAQAQQYAKGLLEDVEEWIIEVRKLDGGLGQPVITFDHCLEPGHWINPEPEAKDASVACDEAAKPLAYTLAIEAFLKRKLKENSTDKGEKIVGEEFGHLVHRYTAWDEPDNKGLVPGSTTEHVEPTYNQPKLAGEYWFDLDELCRGDKYDCEVAAGDFLDSALPDALHEKHLNHEPNPGYTYMKEYLAGTHYPRQINRWAWHAYTDGAETHLKLKGERKKWWARFKNFAEVVMKYDPQANIWLLEQGAVFILPRTEAKTQKEEEEKERKEIETGARLPEGAEGEAQADEILSAYVQDGKYQLTRIDKQIKWFYYYQMRAEDKPKFQGFDSGLLEEKPTTEGEVTYNKKPASAPRDIYSVYKNKTPKS